MASPSPGLSADVLSELDSLAASSSFRRAPGLLSLLRFLVETELRGEGETLKETLIGAAVFRREADYDPKADGIVRVNANRLRYRLTEHYRQYPSPLQIMLRAGSYRPQFEVTVAEEESPAPIPLTPGMEAPPSATRRAGGWGWATAGLVILLSCALFWRFHNAQPRWSEQPLSRMTGVQSFADFSPDNLHIAYAVEDTGSDTSLLYIQDLTGGVPVKVSSEDRYETRPAWSPDGKSLAFVVRDKEALRIVARSLQGDAESEIFSRPRSGPWLCDVPRISWSHDGTEIITVAPPAASDLASGAAPSAGCGVVAVNVRTHALRPITRSPARTQGDLEPVISPDGSTVAFLRETSYAMLDVMVVGIDGQGLRRIPLQSEDIQGIAWMPDGKGLLLSMRLDQDQLHLVRFDLASGKTYSVQNSAAPMAFATVSRDGRHIAFTEYHQTNKVIRLQNGALTDLFADSVLRANAAASPDGGSIAYSSDRSGRNQIWISDANGLNERMLTSINGAGANRPTWSADGRSIVFECRQSTSSNLCVQSLSSKKAAVLVQMGSDAILPTLSHDGARLYFTSNASGTYEGYRQRLHLSAGGELSADGKPEKLSVGGVNFISESDSGKTLYLRGGDPARVLLNAPASLPSISTSPDRLDPGYGLVEPGSRDNVNLGAVANEGLLLAEQENTGLYHFLLYREATKKPVVAFAPQQLDPIDGIAWEASRNSLLLTTRSRPTGTLRLLSGN